MLGATCNRDGQKSDAGTEPTVRIELPGVDTKELTPREHGTWSVLVSELIAPCPDVAVPIAECVKDKRNCDLCLPAAQFLLQRVRAGRTKQEVTELYELRFDPKHVKTIVIGDSPVKGAQDAVVTVIEFADFECPTCGFYFQPLEEIYGKYSKQIRMVFKHFPLEVHPNAKLAAQAAVAAQLQSQFWKMHRKLFENQDRLTEPDLIGYAEELGLDVDRFKKDLHSDAVVERVAQERAQGESLGIRGTPSIYIDGREVDIERLNNPQNPVPELEEWIDLELKHAGKTPGAPSSAAPTASASAAPSTSASASAPPSASPTASAAPK